MSRRLSPWVAEVVVFAVAATGCPSSPPPSSCQFETHQIIGTSLTLLPDARLDSVRDGFVLLGTDGDKVRWAALSKGGVIGDEHEIDLRPHVGQPLFAVAGSNSPMDRLVVAYVPAGSPTVGMVDLMTFTAGFDNTQPTLPAMAGQIPAGAKVAMVSGKAGRHAGLAFGVPGAPSISVRILGGDGHASGSDLIVGTPADFDCLRFSPGREDLTVGYVDLSGTPPAPTFVGTEITEEGVALTGFRLPIGRQLPGCVELVPADTGYGVAWHSAGIGTYFGVTDPAKSVFSNELVLSDVRVAGGPPSLGGLGWMGKNYALVFAHETGAEVWSIDANGRTQGVLPVFPSNLGRTGSLSTQPVGANFYATYADYTASDPANRAVGLRLLVRVSCPQSFAPASP
jgi:hypothetical protein